MSSIVGYRKKSFPLSLALGISQTLLNKELEVESFLIPWSYEEEKTFLFHTKNLAISCFNPQPKKRGPNPLLFSLAVRRVLALKSHSPFPVIIAVKTQEEGRAFAEELERSGSGGKLFNMIYSLKDKFPKDFLTSTQTEADFILLTYHKLRELVVKKANPTTEQIVFINPLSKRRCAEDALFLDDIIAIFHRHKCRKPFFSFLFDCTLFPPLTREEYQELLGVEQSLYFRLAEPKRTYFDNQLRETVSSLFDEQIQLFILRELFRGRKSLKKLFQRFKKTITYHLYRYSNNLYPSLQELIALPSMKKELAFAASLDNKILLNLSQTLNLFHKGVTKTITGKVSFVADLDDQRLFSWNEPIETAPFLQLVEKKQDRNYYLTTLGEAVLVSTTHLEGVQQGFSQFLHDLAHTLYKNKDPTAKLSLEEIIAFFCLLIGLDPIELPEQLQEFLKKEDQQFTTPFHELLDDFIEQYFNFRVASYEGMASIQLLSAFKELMDDQALQFLQHLQEHKKGKKQFLKEQLQEEIVRLAQHSILSEKALCQKYKLEEKEVKKALKSLVAEELLVSFKMTDCCGRIAVKYCSKELLEKNPQLKTTCGDCLFYNGRFKTCSLLRLVAVNAPSIMPNDYWKYVFEPIEKETTACMLKQERKTYTQIGNSLRFTLTKEQLTLKMQHIPTDFLLGQTPKTHYHCLTCQTIIESFGDTAEPYFPQKRIRCSNCATTYFSRDNKTVVVQAEHRHFLRMKYYQLTGSIPEILEEKEPYHAFTIYDTEQVEVATEAEDDSLTLVFGKNKIPLSKVQHLFFAGKQYQELEERLVNLAKEDPKTYHYEVARVTGEKEQKEEPLAEQPYSSREYRFLQGLITFLHDQKTFNLSFATTRHLSNIAGMLHLRKLSFEQGKPCEWINRQLYEMVDLLLRVQAGIETSAYGRQLEALSNNFFFELLKEEGLKVGLWSYGRVTSRLVKDMLLSFSNKLTNAYAPFDALLNQLVKSIRSKIDPLFHKIGLKPAELGPGFYHRRKTKSAIDKLGLYFDLIEPMRVLVLITFYEAMKKGLLSEKDCKYVLGSNNQEIYRVRFSSLDKINHLVDEALAMPVEYNGQSLPILQAFEQYIHSFKQAIDACKEYYFAGNRLTEKAITHLFEEVGFQPFVFCPVDCEDELELVNKFTHKFAVFYDEAEWQVLEDENLRQSTRVKLLERWRVKEQSEKKPNIKLTKHQHKEQERSLLIALFLLYQGFQNDLFFGYYPTSNFQVTLGLTQNQVQRVLTRMTERGLLVKMKHLKSSYYQLNLENKTIHELLFSVGLVECQNEAQRVLLTTNSSKVLSQVAALVDKYSDTASNYHSKPCWSAWKPPTSFKQFWEWLPTQVSICEQIIGTGE